MVRVPSLRLVSAHAPVTAQTIKMINDKTFFIVILFLVVILMINNCINRPLRTVQPWGRGTATGDWD